VDIWQRKDDTLEQLSSPLVASDGSIRDVVGRNELQRQQRLQEGALVREIPLLSRHNTARHPAQSLLDEDNAVAAARSRAQAADFAVVRDSRRRPPPSWIETLSTTSAASVENPYPLERRPTAVQPRLAIREEPLWLPAAERKGKPAYTSVVHDRRPLPSTNAATAEEVVTQQPRQLAKAATLREYSYFLLISSSFLLIYSLPLLCSTAGEELNAKTQCQIVVCPIPSYCRVG